MIETFHQLPEIPHSKSNRKELLGPFLSILDDAWYIPRVEIDSLYIFNTFATFLVLFNYIIPISLYVTMGKFLFWNSIEE